MSLKFQKRKEDFVCGHCGYEVAGNGYTNHCPKCLWSRHVDEYPGDRANGCLGMMEPIRFILDKGEHILIHRCIRCEKEKKNRMSEDDDREIGFEIGD